MPIVLKRPSSKTSKTDWLRVRVMSDRGIAVSTKQPEVSVKHIVRSIVRRGLKAVPPKARWWYHFYYD